MAKCVFHCLDMQLTRDWLKTCGEYAGYILHPFPSTPLESRLWPFGKQLSLDEHEAAFKDWSVLQFWVGILAGIVVTVLELVSNPDNMAARMVASTVSGCIRVIAAFIFSHLSWYSVVKKHGCCCIVLACCECQPVLLFWGVLAMFWGITGLATAMASLSWCSLCIVGVVVAAFHAITLFYLGFACLNIWKLSGAEIVPPVVEVQGPEGQTVGAANLA